jgi:hypothetical protein
MLPETLIISRRLRSLHVPAKLMLNAQKMGPPNGAHVSTWTVPKKRLSYLRTSTGITAAIPGTNRIVCQLYTLIAETRTKMLCTNSWLRYVEGVRVEWKSSHRQNIYGIRPRVHKVAVFILRYFACSSRCIDSTIIISQCRA